MSAMTPCPADSPLMQEWEKYKQSDEYANSFKWAAYEEHRKGSMWAAFMAGFLAANPSGAKPMTHGENNEGDLKRERDEAREALRKIADDPAGIDIDAIETACRALGRERTLHQKWRYSLIKKWQEGAK